MRAGGDESFSTIVRILLLKKLMKPFPLRATGIHGSIELWSFVSMAKVLKMNLRLFLFFSASDE